MPLFSFVPSIVPSVDYCADGGSNQSPFFSMYKPLFIDS